MGLETSTTIQGLNIAWPLGTDPRSEGDNHLRLVKTVLKNVFDDSSANVLLFKVIGPRFGKSATSQQLEAMQGTTVRGQLFWNVGAGVAPLARLRAYTDAGAVANTLTLDDTGLTISVGTFTISAVVTTTLNVSGAMTGRDLVLDPTSPVTGLHIKPSDANSGRLFLESTTRSWSITAWESDGALQFSSGGTYGNATGTTRARLYENGQFETAAELLSRYSLKVNRDGIGGTPRAAFGVYASFSVYMARLGTDGATAEGTLALPNTNTMEYTPAAGQTSGNFELNNASGQRRLTVAFSSTNPLAIVARNDSDVVLASLVANASGVPFWTYGSGTSSEMITVATLSLTVYTGSSVSNTTYPVGSIISMYTNGVAVARNAAATPCLSNNDSIYYRLSGQPNAGTALPGTWRARGHIDSNWVSMQKVAD